MGLKRRFFRGMKSEERTEENSVAKDLFWGTLAFLTLTFAQIFSGIIHWRGWFLLAAGVMSICLVGEVLRFRLPLLPKQKATRRTSLFIISCLLLVSIAEFIGTFFPK